MALTSIKRLSDAQLVDRIRQGVGAEPALIDEYYRRCIPIYQDFLGRHWHTGWYEPGSGPPSPDDQERMIRVIAESAQLKPGMRVLDVGCGIGATVGWLSRELGVEAVGLTPVPEQKHLSDLSLHGQVFAKPARIELGRAEHLPFPSGSFDAVVFFESLCHVEDRSAFFREAFRVLRPGGRLAGEDWLRRAAPDVTHTQALLDQVQRLWAIPALASGEHYLQGMQEAGFHQCEFHDLREYSALERGFAVERSQQISLAEQINESRDPLLILILEGLLALGHAMAAGCFTIGRFRSVRPADKILR